jgi:hypothetical protein
MPMDGAPASDLLPAADSIAVKDRDMSRDMGHLLRQPSGRARVSRGRAPNLVRCCLLILPPLVALLSLPPGMNAARVPRMFAPVGFYVTAQSFLYQLGAVLCLPPGAPLMNDGLTSLHCPTLPFSLRLCPGSLLSSSSLSQMTP